MCLLLVEINLKKKNLEYVGNTFNTYNDGYNRLAFPKEEKNGINWLENELTIHGIDVRRYSIGNLFARIGLKEVMVYAFGFYFDTIKNRGFMMVL